MEVDPIVLDGAYMKNVIIRNARLIYNGGVTKLENVYFVNCTFDLGKNKPTLDFSQAILQADSVNFDTSQV
jgi:hypothetical protein